MANIPLGDEKVQKVSVGIQIKHLKKIDKIVLKNQRSKFINKLIEKYFMDNN